MDELKMKNMKTIRLLLALGLLAVLFSSCHKENVTLRLRFTAFNQGGKVYIGENRYPQWNPMVDSINVNGVAYVVSDNRTVLVDASDCYRAVYPSHIVQGITGAGVASLRLPRNQEYLTARVDNAEVQIVQAPISASLSHGSTLEFNNGGALLAVNVVNDYDQGTLVVDSITVSASAMALWGEATLDFSEAAPAYTIAEGQGSHTSVTLGPIRHSLAFGHSKLFYIYLPAAPNGVQNLFTINVAAHSGYGAGSFTRSQSGGVPGSGNIGRGNMASLDFSLASATTGVWTPNEYPVGTISEGRFTTKVNGKKVYFAAGNLQYYCDTSSPKWRIAPSQDYICGADNNAPAANTGRWIDLFGWGTSGYAADDPYPNHPYQTGLSRRYYGPRVMMSIGSSLHEWGVYIYYNEEDISYDGISANQLRNDYPWRVLTRLEWLYLINPTGSNSYRRINGMGGLGHTYSIVRVNGTVGLLIFHDDFTQGGPTSLDPVEEVDLADYPGCAFLPYAGYRDVAGDGSGGGATVYYPNDSKSWYWTTDYPSDNGNYNNEMKLERAIAMQINYLGMPSSVLTPTIQASDHYRYKGFPVRLVRDIPRNQ